MSDLIQKLCGRFSAPEQPSEVLSVHPAHCFPLQDPKVTEARDFDRFGTNFQGSPEPIYGSFFLPRKFKIAVTVPGDNSVDLFTNDIGIVVLTSPSGELEGYDLVVGGGMGRSHRQVSQILSKPPSPYLTCWTTTAHLKFR